MDAQNSGRAARLHELAAKFKALASRTVEPQFAALYARTAADYDRLAEAFADDAEAVERPEAGKATPCASAAADS